MISVWLNVGAAKLQYLERYEMIRTPVVQDSSSHHSFSLPLELNNDVNNDGVPTNTTAKGDSSNISNNPSPSNNEHGEGSSSNASTTSGTFITSTNDLAVVQQPLPTSTRHEHWLIYVLLVWIILLSFLMFVPMSNKLIATIIGVVVNLNLVVFYGAPLSTILEVLQTKSSQSIHRGTLGKFLYKCTWIE